MAPFVHLLKIVPVQEDIVLQRLQVVMAEKLLHRP
jgi:hypothetical protein